MVLHGGICTEEHFAPITALFKGAVSFDRVKAFLDSACGLICCKDALTGRDHFDGDVVESLNIHEISPWFLLFF